MVSKPHRNNSDFQLRNFIANSCHTPDGAWMLLYGEKINIEVTIKHTKAQKLRRDAVLTRANAILNSETSSDADKMEAEADVIENTAGENIWKLNTEAAIAELKTITELMDELEPQRKYKHLSILEANEACQEEEWCLELKNRAENFLITQGSIPHDQLEIMRLHPKFQEEIVPHIGVLLNNMGKLTTVADGLKLVSSKTFFNNAIEDKTNI